MRNRHLPVFFAGLCFGMGLTQPVVAQKAPVATAQVNAAETVSFEVFLPQQHRQELEALVNGLSDATSPSYHQWLTPEQVQARFGVAPGKVAAIENELARFGLTTTQVAPRLLQVTGPASAAQQALSIRLLHGKAANGKAVIFASTAPTPTASMQEVGALITGLSGRQHMHHDVQRKALPDNRQSPYGLYWFDDLKQAYTWPTYKSYTGKGATVAVLMSGGFSQADMDIYFHHEGLATPQFSTVPVLGGSPFDPTGDGTFEASLDLQQTGGMAPDANIVLYSIPDLSDYSVIAGLAKIIADNKADVVNMSFGGAELGYTAPYNDGVDYTPILLAEDDLFAEGNAQGITFVAASGDQGALSIPAPLCFTSNVTPCGAFLASAIFPASSPHVTGVGGTNLITTYSPGSLDSAYVSEEAFANPLSADIFYGTAATGGYWGSGGGDSMLFKRPAYQKLVDTGNKRARTVPDLALHMGGCPADATCYGGESADIAVVGGYGYGLIGTSASAPDFAGLTALNIQKLGFRVGNENTYIYTLSALQNLGVLQNVFHRNIPGFNGLYSSGNDGYNRVLGNGTLFGKDFILAPSVRSAGQPGTPSNP